MTIHFTRTMTLTNEIKFSTKAAAARFARLSGHKQNGRVVTYVGSGREDMHLCLQHTGYVQQKADLWYNARNDAFAQVAVEGPDAWACR